MGGGGGGREGGREGDYAGLFSRLPACLTYFIRLLMTFLELESTWSKEVKVKPMVTPDVQHKHNSCDPVLLKRPF